MIHWVHFLIYLFMNKFFNNSVPQFSCNIHILSVSFFFLFSCASLNVRKNFFYLKAKVLNSHYFQNNYLFFLLFIIFDCHTSVNQLFLQIRRKKTPCFCRKTRVNIVKCLKNSAKILENLSRHWHGRTLS